MNVFLMDVKVFLDSWRPVIKLTNLGDFKKSSISNARILLIALLPKKILI